MSWQLESEGTETRVRYPWDMVDEAPDNPPGEVRVIAVTPEMQAADAAARARRESIAEHPWLAVKVQLSVDNLRGKRVPAGRRCGCGELLSATTKGDACQACFAARRREDAAARREEMAIQRRALAQAKSAARPSSARPTVERRECEAGCGRLLRSGIGGAICYDCAKRSVRAMCANGCGRRVNVAGGRNTFWVCSQDARRALVDAAPVRRCENGCGRKLLREKATLCWKCDKQRRIAEGIEAKRCAAGCGAVLRGNSPEDSCYTCRRLARRRLCSGNCGRFLNQNTTRDLCRHCWRAKYRVACANGCGTLLTAQSVDPVCARCRAAAKPVRVCSTPGCGNPLRACNPRETCYACEGTRSRQRATGVATMPEMQCASGCGRWLLRGARRRKDHLCRACGVLVDQRATRALSREKRDATKLRRIVIKTRSPEEAEANAWWAALPAEQKRAMQEKVHVQAE